MGNCQAAEAATVVVQHPGGKVERVYFSINASRVMADNPGHYVAAMIAAPCSGSSNRTDGNAGSKNNGRRNAGSDGHAPVKHLKLLRPDDMLLIGHVYRLVSFEEVVRKFETKRHAKLSRLVENTGNMEMSTSSTHGRTEARKESEKNHAVTEVVRDNNNDDDETDELVSVAQALILPGTSSRSCGSRPCQWRPALQTISEIAGS